VSIVHPRLRPKLGLVCLTTTNEIRYRTITRKRLLSLTLGEQEEALTALYVNNIGILARAVAFCRAQGISLYRISSQIFPFADEAIGIEILGRLQNELGEVGRAANNQGLRMIFHPDQFVVLNSDSAAVVQNSVKILAMQARTLDYLQQPQSAWATLELHGGKGKRGKELIAVIPDLPPNIRSRLALENDEYSYGAAEILEICQATATPMVFDAHHHICHERLDSYEDSSIRYFVEAARTTWPVPEWQVAHISNGRDFFTDRRHSDMITTMPSAYQAIPWIEVEAKAKEIAVRQLQDGWLAHL
jgi:UV DNA damage endonuclease